MNFKLLKTIAALLSIAVAGVVIFGLGYWCCEAVATCVQCRTHRPLVYITAALFVFIGLAVAGAVWFVATVDRHFGGSQRLAAKGIERDYDSLRGDSREAP